SGLSGTATGICTGLSPVPMVKVPPLPSENVNTAATETVFDSASGRSVSCRYRAARPLSSTQPPAGTTTWMSDEPMVGDGEGDGDPDGDAEGDADALAGA